MPFERRFRPHSGVVPFLGAGFFCGGLFCGGLCFALVCAIVMVIDLWSGLSVTLIVADAQMIGAIYGVKQARRFVSARNRGRRRLWLRVFLLLAYPVPFTRGAWAVG